MIPLGYRQLRLLWTKRGQQKDQHYCEGLMTITVYCPPNKKGHLPYISMHGCLRWKLTKDLENVRFYWGLWQEKKLNRWFSSAQTRRPEKNLKKVRYYGFDELFLWHDWPTKGIKIYFQARALSEILTIVNLWQAGNRIWSCAELEFRLCWMKLCSSHNHYTMAPLHHWASV